jgi:hypothetical protein
VILVGLAARIRRGRFFAASRQVAMGYTVDLRSRPRLSVKRRRPCNSTHLISQFEKKFCALSVSR